MRKLTGTVLTWLLLLAIPLQGYAATAVSFCGPGHHGVLAQTDIQPPKAEHQHGQLLNSSYPEQDQVQSKSGPQLDELTQGHRASSKVGDDKCSAYSAIVSTPCAIHLSVPGPEQIPYVQESFVNYTPERLDPPPRAVLA